MKTTTTTAYNKTGASHWYYPLSVLNDVITYKYTFKLLQLLFYNKQLLVLAEAEPNSDG